MSEVPVVIDEEQIVHLIRVLNEAKTGGRKEEYYNTAYQLFLALDIHVAMNVNQVKILDKHKLRIVGMVFQCISLFRGC